VQLTLLRKKSSRITVLVFHIKQDNLHITIVPTATFFFEVSKFTTKELRSSEGAEPALLQNSKLYWWWCWWSLAYTKWYLVLLWNMKPFFVS